ncbi:MAG: dephospho-CoA kinase [Pseudomonadota bacterium]
MVRSRRRARRKVAGDPRTQSCVRRRRRSLRIGLTGGLAAGKSTVAALLRADGYAVFDADAASRASLSPLGDATAALLARRPELANTNGAVDRARLRRWAADDPKNLRLLEDLIHPIVRRAMLRFLDRTVVCAAFGRVCDVPLLYETDAASLFDVVVVVDAAAPIRRQRALARPGVDAPTLAHLEAAQTPPPLKRRMAAIVIRSGLGRRDLRRQLRAKLRAPRSKPMMPMRYRRALGDYMIRSNP